ncbi:Flp family type IVb pilin [Maritimibacter dapengensis]|uniref:Flp pilus assembly protein, pilin Flp n=1 Tax=Maritimibacter dapengensis TaxID=2836868 RepID=A0ABS6SZJ9_9RHOB|nr:hypothetical protein [Maritimibacter dapengensis]MBV7377776.1 hypothetical protein [Maritimibacter dapengensis]
MHKIFERFMSEEEGNALIDWTVLMAGLVLMALSVVLTITGNVDDITEHTNDRIEAQDQHLPS